MQLLLRWCTQAVDRAPLALWPSAPIASSQVSSHPGLLQWLALADSKQCTPLVEACLSQLLCQESDAAIHEAAASPHLRQLIDGLRPETKTSIIFKMAGLPLGFQVLMMPSEHMYHMAGLPLGFQVLSGRCLLNLCHMHVCFKGSSTLCPAPMPIYCTQERTP